MSDLADQRRIKNINMQNHLARGFHESSRRYPDSPALSLNGEEISYGQLSGVARQIASCLTKAPVTDAPLTAVLGHRSLTAFAGILGALYAGHGYVPLNPDFPVARLKGMLLRSGCRSIVVESALIPLLPELLADVSDPLQIIVDGEHEKLELEKKFNKHNVYCQDECSEVPESEPRHINEIAYLLFTSGSTGIPKGVMVSHDNVCSFLSSAQQRYQLSSSDRVSQTFALTFDLSVFDMFLAWSAGACVCVPNANELIKPGNYIRRERLSLWFSVPSTALFMKKFGELKPDMYPTLKWSLFCGEALSEAIADTWSKSAPNSTLENLYGPTELTIACTVYRWKPGRSGGENQSGSTIVPIGEPLPNMREMIVDDDLKPVPPGVVGELILTGPQLTPGYLNDPEKNAKAFRRPAGAEEIYYLTGDSVIRRTENHPIEYIGRKDNQIQVNGHRVELGEIESVIRARPEIDEAVAIGWPRTDTGAGGIVVFLLGGSIDTKLLFAELKQQLPDYMAPNQIKIVDRFPLNSNGKIDRNALQQILADRKI